MSRQDTEKAPVTFQDVAACFSEMEWKLLHEWQKELYRNVMKDIHQALVALGPLIATSVFALRAEVREPMSPVGMHDSVRRPSAKNFPGLHFLVSESEDRFMDHIDGEREASSSIISEFSSLNPDSMMRVDDQSSAGFMECMGTEQKESRISPGAGDSNIPPVLSHIKEKKEMYTQPALDTEGRSTGTGSMTRKWDAGKSLKCIDKATGFKTLPREGDLNVLEISENGKYSQSYVWSKSNQEIGVQHSTEGESSFSKPTHSSLGQGNAKSEISIMGNEREGNLINATQLTCKTSTVSHSKPCTYSEFDKSSRQNVSSYRHQKTLLGEGEKSHLYAFSDKSPRMGHQKIHNREREYPCTDCEKSFMRKHHLVEHKRIHSGEKPYECTICGKNFCRSGALNRHVKTHTFPESLNNVLPGIECMQKGDPDWTL
ncbi:zinc finger protein 684-like isoform X2 [Ambystoma mexicanum]|uniref:zinc finger protein 684-like isoform X2 n=1 Tax=Ambystoma mexicanum TaxID=8296 RepID=UPI0037E93308